MLTVFPVPAMLSLNRPVAPSPTVSLSDANLPGKTALEISSVASVDPSKVLSTAEMPLIWEMGAGCIC